MNVNNTPMTAALARAFAISVISVASVGLATYVSSSHNWYTTAAAVLASTLTVLGGRGLVEGSVDTFRASSAAAGHTEHIHPSDVGAFSPGLGGATGTTNVDLHVSTPSQEPVAAPVVAAPVSHSMPVGDHHDLTGDYHPPVRQRD